MIDEALFDVLPKFYAKIERYLGNNKFLFGDQMTIGDFYIGGHYVNFATNPFTYEPELRAQLL